VEGGDFERWLRQELQHLAVRKSGPSPMPAQAQYHAAYLQGGAHVSFLVKALVKAATVVSAKGAIGLTVAALAIGGAGAAAAITGSANPTNWGQQVVQQIQKCKDVLAPSSHGIGKCVSSFANNHGKQVSSEHRANGASGNPPTNHPTGPPTSHPGPNNHPGGRPSSTP
jgi:hypothetical protein